jgi:hypothetical protein
MTVHPWHHPCQPRWPRVGRVAGGRSGRAWSGDGLMAPGDVHPCLSLRGLLPRPVLELHVAAEHALQVHLHSTQPLRGGGQQPRSLTCSASTPAPTSSPRAGADSSRRRACTQVLGRECGEMHWGGRRRQDVSWKRRKCRFRVVGKTGRRGKSLPSEAHPESPRLVLLTRLFSTKALIICPNQAVVL